MLAVVLLTRRRLGVEVRHHRLNLTELPGELRRTLAAVLVDAVPAGPAVLTHVVGAVVHVGRAVLADEPGEALAGVVGEVVLAGPAILAGVPLDGGAEGDLLLAVAALEAGDAAALVLPDLVDAGPVVLAPVLRTVVHVLLAPHPLEPGRTLAAENIS